MLTDEETELKNKLIKKLQPTVLYEKSQTKRVARCQKVKFTKKEAATLLNYIKHKDRAHRRRKETRFYHCPQCNAWHLTKQPNKN